MLRILLIESDRVFRSRVSGELAKEPEFRVATALPTIPSGMDATRDVDAVVLGLDLCSSKEVSKARKCFGVAPHPRPPLLILAQNEQISTLESLLKDCARGCALKSDPPLEWIQGVWTIKRGELFVSSSLTQGLLRHVLASAPEPERSGINALTDRELSVLEFLGGGLSAAMIAEKLQVSVKTVDSHREKIKHKLGLRDAHAVAHFALLWCQRGGSEKDWLGARPQLNAGVAGNIIPLP